MSKRLCLLSAGLVAIVAAGAASIPACGGSSSDNPGTGGTGGFMMEGGPSDTGTDTSVPDTSNPETSPPDVSQEPDGTTQFDVEILEGSLFDMTVPDVALGDGGETLQGCYECSEAQCSAELSSCEKDDKCRTLVLCFFQDACFDATQTMGINQGCAFACVGKAGIPMPPPMDPSLTLGLGYAQCLNTKCSEKCGIPDGGLVPEAGPDVIPPSDSGPAPDVVVDVVAQ